MNDQSLSTSSIQDKHNSDYDELVAEVQSNFNLHTDAYTPLFKAPVADLFNIFLGALPAVIRGHYTCNACRSFFNRYGGLVTISTDGGVKSALWSETMVPEDSTFFAAAAALQRAVVAACRSGIDGMFTSKERTLGTPEAGGWSHFSVTLPEGWKWLAHEGIGAPRSRADARHDFENVRRFLATVEVSHLHEVVRVAKIGELPGAEKVLGPAEWARALQEKKVATRNPITQDNLIWRAVVSAPVGFCHPAGSLLGQLVDLVKEGASFAEMARKMRTMVDPLQYQRPQALPTEQNKARAEQLLEELGLASALKRRFARLDEVEAYWHPTARAGESASAGAGVFTAVPTKGSASKDLASSVSTPPRTMTWMKFRTTILPQATALQYMPPHANRSYGAFITAEDDKAAPILKWDSYSQRNHVSWYMYVNGSYPLSWGIRNNVWTDVEAVSDLSCHWFGTETPSIAPAAFLVLKGALDSRKESLGLFPEILKSELREVRSVIETYSKIGVKTGGDYPGQLACGLIYQSSSRSNNQSMNLRAFVMGSWAEFTIDRWD